MRLEITVKVDRLENCPILGGPRFWRNHAVKRIQIGGGAVLTEEREVELGLGNSGTSSKGRLGTELRQYKLLDGIIEKSPAGTDAGLARTPWTPGDAEARSECFVIG